MEGTSVAKHRSIGLDIGATEVRAAETSFSTGGADGELQRYHAVSLPDNAVRDGEVVDHVVVASALKELFAHGGFSSREVILGVGNQRVAVRSLSLPWAPMSQLRPALAYQVQDLLPMPVDEALLDFYPVAEVDDHGSRSLDGMLVAAARETVTANVKAAEAAGLIPVGVDLNAFALLRAMTRGAVAANAVAFVDIGARITTVVIAVRGVPKFVRALPLGGHDVTEALAHALGTQVSEAERLKREQGIGLAKFPEFREGAQAMTEVVTKLVEAIRGTFSYFATSSGGVPLELVSLTGGGSGLLGLGQYIASASRLDVVLGDPLNGTAIAKSAGDASQLQGAKSTMAIAVGLSLAVGVTM